MRFIIRALFVAVVITPFAFAQEEKSLHLDLRERVELAKNEQWQAVRLLRDNRVKVEFTDLKKGRAKIFQGAVESEVLISTEVQKFKDRWYLISIWNSGNMSTIIRVFDPLAESKPLVYEKYSLGQIQYRVLSDGLEVTINQPRSLEPVPKIVKVTWKAGGS